MTFLLSNSNIGRGSTTPILFWLVQDNEVYQVADQLNSCTFTISFLSVKKRHSQSLTLF